MTQNSNKTVSKNSSAVFFFKADSNYCIMYLTIYIIYQFILSTEEVSNAA